MENEWCVAAPRSARVSARSSALWILRQAERGEDSTFEFTTAIVPITVMILLIAFATIVRSAQMPAWMAASECARAAVATLTESKGRQDAEQAAVDSLSGNQISSTSVQIVITGDWTPSSLVSCSVSYAIDVSGVAGFAELTGGSIPMTAQVALRMEPYKSKWH